MSATIKRYQPVGYDFDVDEDAHGNYVLHADHLASHQFDEAKERALFEAEIRSRVGDSMRFDRFSDGYLGAQLQTMWLAWIMCATSRAKAAGGE
jgi:hypothetical protein